MSTQMELDRVIDARAESDAASPAAERRATLATLAIVDGVRSPFAKAFGALSRVPADELARMTVTPLLERRGMEPAEIDEVVFGNVAGPADASNIARVIALRAGVPHDRIAHTVNRNCASGMEAILGGWQALDEGRADVVLAGGTESMSNVPLLWDRRMADVLTNAARARGVWQKVKALAAIRPAYLKPVAALRLGLTDPVCGLNMGETAERLAVEFDINRAEQDEFAVMSHTRAIAAWERGFYDDEVVGIHAEEFGGGFIERDDGPRVGQSMEKLARLKPIFDSQQGTVTAGNSCPLTDGAAAVLLTTASHAEALGQEPLGYVRAYAIAGCDPSRMGLGPVYAMHKLLEQTGMKLADVDLFEINEAFAAQVLACLKALESDAFAQTELGREKGIGTIDRDRLNVNGGAIALGHPVGTSGTRLVLTLLRALRERDLKRGIATLCVGGGQGFAVMVERGMDEE